MLNFNPRSPRGERPRLRTCVSGRGHFNPRSPRGERHFVLLIVSLLTYFNPRSPRGERQDPARSPASFFSHFNPRSPRGERLRIQYCGAERDEFQSTLPSRGATVKRLAEDNQKELFQSTLPSRGATMPGIRFVASQTDFNPRSPRGERLRHDEARVVRRDISIHAPLAGSDVKTGGGGLVLRISIHAPLAGSDPEPEPVRAPQAPFQSTLPSRGATIRSVY